MQHDNDGTVLLLAAREPSFCYFQMRPTTSESCEHKRDVLSVFVSELEVTDNDGTVLLFAAKCPSARAPDFQNMQTESQNLQK